MRRLLKHMVLKYLDKEDPVKKRFKTPKKYRKSGLTLDQALTIREKIKKAFEEDKIYRSNDIGLDDLATHIEHNRYKVSQVINTYFSKNFYAFVNEYRIKEAKHLLASEPHLSVKAIMYEVGFNSKNSFYTAFKKVTGVCPNDYRSSMVYSFEIQMA
ncbi:helix-turn-helix domain-containing protein [Flagellimonas sp. GZD32]|uniref:helix-turn-helix domain-containing protein n=1 Tax=Flagellimonas cixiensis TaxID=3228750 RepID=UPI0035C8A061